MSNTGIWREEERWVLKFVNEKTQNFFILARLLDLFVYKLFAFKLELMSKWHIKFVLTLSTNIKALLLRMLFHTE